jgi:hypothetical protein
MPLVQDIFLVAVVVGFSSLPLALLYGWIVTKGWEQTPTVAVRGEPTTRPSHAHELPKAA